MIEHALSRSMVVFAELVVTPVHMHQLLIILSPSWIVLHLPMQINAYVKCLDLYYILLSSLKISSTAILRISDDCISQHKNHWYTLALKVSSIFRKRIPFLG